MASSMSPFNTWIKKGILQGWSVYTVKILKIGTHEIITVTVLQLEQLAFTVQ